MDSYASIRSIGFPTIALALGLDLTKYKVRKNGQEHYGSCPVHRPKNNSTSFSYLADGKFHCFSCGAKGRGALDLVKLVRGCGFKEAVALLEPLSTSHPPPAKEKEPGEALVASDEVLKPYTGSYEKFKVPCPWLEARCPDAGVRERYGVFAYNNPARRSAYSGRVMLPIRDLQGTLFGYLGRCCEPSTEGTPKYLFPKNLPKSRFLFGADVLKAGMFGQTPLRVVYLVESPFAVMKFASLGLPAVSPFGWSMSTEQIQLVRNIARGIVYLPDSNKRHEAGNALAELAQTVWLRFPPLPDGCDDPEALDREQILALTR